MQRDYSLPGAHHALLTGKINDNNRQLAAIAQQIAESGAKMQEFYECMGHVIDHCAALEQRLQRLERLQESREAHEFANVTMQEEVD
jgi:ubiquinone biosynthesis protein UbiJ